MSGPWTRKALLSNPLFHFSTITLSSTASVTAFDWRNFIGFDENKWRGSTNGELSSANDPNTIDAIRERNRSTPPLGRSNGPTVHLGDFHPDAADGVSSHHCTITVPRIV